MQAAEVSALPEMQSQLLAEFQSRYDRAPMVVAAAPGRVNLIGEHIDYNDGFVLPMAIERYVVIAAAVCQDSMRPTASLYSIDLDSSVDVPLVDSAEPTLDNWGRYVEGVIAGFAQRGIAVPAFDAVIRSNVPHGGGLSSSAALEVATATLIEALTGETLDPIEKALLCQQAEHRYAGVPCGIMDQFSSVFGQADQLMLIDCSSQQCQMVPFESSDISVLITNSNVKHELTGGEYAARRSECDSGLRKLAKSTWRDVTIDDVQQSKETLNNAEFSRARHVVTEIERTRQAAIAFSQSDWHSVGKLMYASHESLRDDFEVSCHELDVLVDIAAKLGADNGVIGSRMTGGGFGGSTVSLVENDKLPSVIDSLTTQYKNVTGLSCDCFASRPAKGAHVLTEQA
ncbi:MAG: galactokinase [Pirellulaceae bacterium]|nr:galactokinase [Pirellulaceae bacterium]